MWPLCKLWVHVVLALVGVAFHGGDAQAAPGAFNDFGVKYRSCTTGDGFRQGDINMKEFTLREDKPLNGAPTYWEPSESWFMFWCSRYTTWMISHKDTMVRMTGNQDTCWLVAYSESGGQLNGASSWREWHQGGWRKVQQGSTVTCKQKETTPVCKPEVMPRGAPSYQWNWTSRCGSSQNARIVDFAQVGFGLKVTQAVILQNTHSAGMQFRVRIDSTGKDSTWCYSWSPNATVLDNENSTSSATNDTNGTETESETTSRLASVPGDCHFALQSTGPFTLTGGEQQAIWFDAIGNIDGSQAGHVEAMAVFYALPGGEAGEWLPFRQVLLKAEVVEADGLAVSPGRPLVSAAPQSSPGVVPSPQQVTLHLSANSSMAVQVSLESTDHVPHYRDVSGGWVEIEQTQYLLQGSKNADDESFAVVLPFDFPLNGKTYHWLHVHVNGLMSLGPCALPNSAKPRDRTSAEAAIVAVAWKDLVCGQDCQGIFVKKESSKVFVTWAGVTDFIGGISTLSRFQAEIIATGDIVLRYKHNQLQGAKMGILPVPSGSALLWDTSGDKTVSLVPWLRPQSFTVQAPGQVNVEVLTHELVTRDGVIVPGETYTGNVVLDASPLGVKRTVPIKVVLAAGLSFQVEGLAANVGLPFKLVVRGDFPFLGSAVAKIVAASTELTSGTVSCREAQGLNLGNPQFAESNLLRWTNVTVHKVGSYRLCLATDGDFAGIYSHFVPGWLGVNGVNDFKGQAEVQTHATVTVTGFAGKSDDLDQARLRILQVGVAGTLASCVEQSTVDITFFPGGAWSPNRTRQFAYGTLSGSYQASEAGLQEIELTWVLSGVALAGDRQVCAALDGNRYVPVGTLSVDGVRIQQASSAACTVGTTCSFKLQCRKAGCSTVTGTVSAVALMPLGSECGTAEPILYESSGNLNDYRLPITQQSNHWIVQTNWSAAAAGSWRLCFCEVAERSLLCRANPSLKGCRWTDSFLCNWKEEFVSFLGKITISGTPPPAPPASGPTVREVRRAAGFECRAGVGCIIGPFPGINLSHRNRVRLTLENTSMVPRPPVCSTSATAPIIAGGLSLPMVGSAPYAAPPIYPPFGGRWVVCYCIKERSGCDNDLQDFEHQVGSITVSGLLPLHGIPVPWCITGQRCILGPLAGIGLSSDDYLEVLSNQGVAVVPDSLTVSGDSLTAVFERPGLAGGWYTLKYCIKCRKDGQNGHGHPALQTYGELSVAGPFEIGRSWECLHGQDCDIGAIGGIVRHDDRLYLHTDVGSSCPPKNWQADKAIAANNRNWKLAAGFWAICYCPKTTTIPCNSAGAFSAPLGVVTVAGVTALLAGRGPAGPAHDLFFEAAAGTLGKWWSSEKMSVWTVEKGVPCSQGSSRAQSRLYETSMMKGAPDILRVVGVDVGPLGPRTACVTFGAQKDAAALNFEAFEAKLDGSKAAFASADGGALAVHSGQPIKLSISGNLLPSPVRLQLKKQPDRVGDIGVNACSGDTVVDLGQQQLPSGKFGATMVLANQNRRLQAQAQSTQGFQKQGNHTDTSTATVTVPTDVKQKSSQILGWKTIPATFPIGVYSACLGWGSLSSSFSGAWVSVGTVEVLFPPPSVSHTSPSAVSMGNLLACHTCVFGVDMSALVEACRACQLQFFGVNMSARDSVGGPHVALSFGARGRCGTFTSELVMPLVCDKSTNSEEETNETTSGNESNTLELATLDKTFTCAATLPTGLLPGSHCILLCVGNCEQQRILDFAEVGTLTITSGAASVGRIGITVGQAQELRVNFKNTSVEAIHGQLKRLAHLRLADDTTCTSGPISTPFHASSAVDLGAKPLGTLYWSLRKDAPGESAICLCMRGGACREAPTEAWEVLGMLVVTAAATVGPSDPADPSSDVTNWGGSQAATFDARQEGPPFSLRLLQEFPADPTELVSGAFAVVAESLQVPRDKVFILEVLRGSVVIVFSVSACGAENSAECGDKRTHLRWRWRQALQDPNSALRVHFGDAVDKEFPAFLNADGCSSHQLSCGTWVESTLPDEEVNELPSSARASPINGPKASPNDDEPLSTRSEKSWFRGWAFAFAASFGSILFAGVVGRLGRRVYRRVRRRHRQKRQRRELETELPKLQRVEVYADELPEDSCPICLGDLADAAEDSSDLMLLPCNHILHTDCVFEWLEMRMQCPLCRCPLLVRDCVVQNVLPAREGRVRPGAQCKCNEPSVESKWWILPSTLANRVSVEVPLPSAGGSTHEEPQAIDNMPFQVPESPASTPEPPMVLPPSTLGLPPRDVEASTSRPSTSGLHLAASPAPTLLGRPLTVSTLALPEGDVHGCPGIDMSPDDMECERALTEVLVEHGLLDPQDASSSAVSVDRCNTRTPGIFVPADPTLANCSLSCVDGPIAARDLVRDSNSKEDDNVEEGQRDDNYSPSIVSMLSEGPPRPSTRGTSHSISTVGSSRHTSGHPAGGRTLVNAGHSLLSSGAQPVAVDNDDSDQDCRLDEVHRLLRELPPSPIDSIEDISARREPNDGQSSDPPSVREPMESESTIISHL